MRRAAFRGGLRVERASRVPVEECGYAGCTGYSLEVVRCTPSDAVWVGLGRTSGISVSVGGSAAPAVVHPANVVAYGVGGGRFQAAKQVNELARWLLRHSAQAFIGDVVHAGPLQLPQQIRHALLTCPGAFGDTAITSSRSPTMAKSSSGIPLSAAIWTDCVMYCTATCPC